MFDGVGARGVNGCDDAEGAVGEGLLGDDGGEDFFPSVGGLPDTLCSCPGALTTASSPALRFL